MLAQALYTYTLDWIVLCTTCTCPWVYATHRGCNALGEHTYNNQEAHCLSWWQTHKSSLYPAAAPPYNTCACVRQCEGFMCVIDIPDYVVGAYIHRKNRIKKASIRDRSQFFYDRAHIFPTYIWSCAFYAHKNLIKIDGIENKLCVTTYGCCNMKSKTIRRIKKL